MMLQHYAFLARAKDSFYKGRTAERLVDLLLCRAATSGGERAHLVQYGVRFAHETIIPKKRHLHSNFTA